MDLWRAEICICVSCEGGKPPIRNTVGSDKTDDKAERIDDKLLTVLAHVFRPSPPADMDTVSLLSDACIICEWVARQITGEHYAANLREI